MITIGDVYKAASHGINNDSDETLTFQESNAYANTLAENLKTPYLHMFGNEAEFDRIANRDGKPGMTSLDLVIHDGLANGNTAEATRDNI
jgi:hypothetical protein